MGNICSSDSANLAQTKKSDPTQQQSSGLSKKKKTQSKSQAKQILQEQQLSDLLALQLQKKQQKQQKQSSKPKKKKTKKTKKTQTSKTTSSSKKEPLICQVLKKENALPLKDGKVVNPHTGRVIQGGGKLFQELTQGCQKVQKDKIKKVLKKEEPIAKQDIVINPKTKYKINQKKGTFKNLTK